MTILDNNGLTLTHSLSSTFRFSSLNNISDDDGTLKIYSSFYKYNFVIFIITYLLYSSFSDELINLVTLLSTYFIMLKGGNVIYHYLNDNNYSFIDSFQQDSIINFSLIFNDHDNDFKKQLSYVLDTYPIPPINLQILSQLLNTLVLFSIHFIDLFLFFNIGFIPIISFPFAGCMITHYYNTNTVEITETVENMVLSDEDGEDGEDGEDNEDNKDNKDGKDCEDEDDEDDEDITSNNQDNRERETKKEI